MTQYDVILSLKDIKLSIIFFGVKTKEILPSLKSPVPASRCRLVSTTLQDKLGKLIKVNENTYQTINKLKIKYTWPTSNTGTVANIVIQKVPINYNFITKTIGVSCEWT